MWLLTSGKHITRLKAYTDKLNQFPLDHDLGSHSNNQLQFDGQLMKWHSDFYNLLVCNWQCCFSFSIYTWLIWWGWPKFSLVSLFGLRLSHCSWSKCWNGRGDEAMRLCRYGEYLRRLMCSPSILRNPSKVTSTLSGLKHLSLMLPSLSSTL